MLECGMSERDRLTLRKRSTVLIKEMVVDELLIQSLQADDILTESMAESILAERTSHKRSWRLLLLLPKRGPRAFHSFCSVLRETEQQHLCALLAQSPERDGRERAGETSQAEVEPGRETEQLVTPKGERERSPQTALDTDSEVSSSSTSDPAQPKPQIAGSPPSHSERETQTERENCTSPQTICFQRSPQTALDTDSEVSSSSTSDPAQPKPQIAGSPPSHSERETQTGRKRGAKRDRGAGREDEMERYVDSPLPLPTQEGIAAKRARTHESMEMSLDTDSPITTPVLPCSHDFYLTHYQQSYGMASPRRGFALVISNVTFDPCAAPDLDPRKGGEVDEEVLRKVLTELDYLVTVRRDLTAEGMRGCIEEFRRRTDHRTVDSSVVCLLSHGVEGAIYGTDGQLVQLDWVFEAFDNAHCPLLQNKPKMFFIQACRGEEMDCGVEQTDGPERTVSPSCEQRDAGREGEDAGSRQREESGRPRIKLPQRSDMICGYASLKGTAAMRNTKRGSWFIQELNTALRLRARDTHLADILVQVNGRIKEREGFAPGTAHHRCKEMSEFTSSLCKDLYLFPKYYPQY